MENEGIMSCVNWVVVVTVFGMVIAKLIESYFHSNYKTFFQVIKGMSGYILGSVLFSHLIFWIVYLVIGFINLLLNGFISQDFLENEIYITISIFSGIIVCYDWLQDPAVVKNYTYYISDEENWLTNPEIRRLRREIVKPNNNVRKIKNKIFKERKPSNSYYFLDGRECIKIYEDDLERNGSLHRMEVDYKYKNKENYIDDIRHFW